jgi:hypothetical protein
MMRNDDPPGGVWFRVNGAGAWNGGDVHVNETVYEPDVWVHMAFTFDSSTYELKCYVNGELKGTKITEDTRSVASETNSLIMGGASEQYEGLMDEVYIYDVVLTEAEISNLAGI